MKSYVKPEWWLVAAFIVCGVGAPLADAATRTWTGANIGPGGNAHWSNNANWIGPAPVAGDDLVFPETGAANYTVNDIAAGTRFNSITIQGIGYEIYGNPITLAAADALTITTSNNAYFLATTFSNVGATIAASNAGISFLGSITITGGSLTFNADNASIIVAQPIVESGSVIARVIKEGSGYVSLLAENAYSGHTIVNEGELMVRHRKALGKGTNSPADGTIVNSGGSLVLDATVANEHLVLNGSQYGGTFLTASQSGDSWGGDVVLNTADVEFDLRGGPLTISGRVTGPGNLTFGGNTLTLTNPSNDWEGETNIGSYGITGTSVLKLGASHVIPNTSAVTIRSLGVFDLDNRHEVVASLTASLSDFDPLLIMGTGSLWTGGNHDSTTFAGNIEGAASSTLLKDGAGTMTVSRNNAEFLGTTAIKSGAVLVESAGSLSHSTIILGRDGIIEGNGNVGPIVSAVDGGGEIRPGTSPGRLTAASLSLDGGQLTIELNGATPITQYDQLAVNGSVALNNAGLVVTLGYAPALGQQFKIIDKIGGGAVSGTFNGLPHGGTLTVGQFALHISYTGGNGNDVVLVVVQVPVAPPVLQSAASRKSHGAAGTFDLPLSLAPTNPTTEPRMAGVNNSHTIVFTFDKIVVSGSAAATGATAGVPIFNGNEMIVPITAATNAQYATVTVSNVLASGSAGGSGSIRLGFLLGDVSQNRVVTLSDLGQVNAQIARPVTAANYLKDVNASGTLSLADKGIANSQLTKGLPAP